MQLFTILAGETPILCTLSIAVGDESICADDGRITGLVWILL